MFRILPLVIVLLFGSVAHAAEAVPAAMQATPAMAAPALQAAPAPAMAAPVPAMTAPTAAMVAAPLPAMQAPVPAPVPTVVATPVAPTPTVDQPGTYTAQDASPVVPAVTKAATPLKAAQPAAKPSAFGATTIISLVGTCLLLLLSLLGTLGFLKWTQTARWQTILSATKKGTEAFIQYAKGTPATWDDALAAVLDNVAAVLLHGGLEPLSPEEREKVKALATSFQKVATLGTKPETPADEKKA